MSVFNHPFTVDFRWKYGWGHEFIGHSFGVVTGTWR